MFDRIIDIDPERRIACSARYQEPRHIRSCSAFLQGGIPEIIATANVGCRMYLESGTRPPARHWIELFDQT